jgi:hypothetical protein
MYTKKLACSLATLAMVGSSGFFVGITNAQTLAGQVEVTRFEGSLLGRGAGDQAMWVRHRVDYCVKGASNSESGIFAVEFTSKNVDAKQAQSGRGNVRGKLTALHEPVTASTPVCGVLEFGVHADAVLGVAAFAPESNPMLTARTTRGQVLGVATLGKQTGARKR